MGLQTKALIYQLCCFAVLFIVFRLFLEAYSGLEGYWVPITAFVIGTLLSPKFQAVKTRDGEKLFMKWLFIKGIKQIK